MVTQYGSLLVIDTYRIRLRWLHLTMYLQLNINLFFLITYKKKEDDDDEEKTDRAVKQN